MKRIFGWCLFFLCLSFHGFAKHVVVFGDSLSDEGRVFARMQGEFPDPAHYSQGRFSNGPVWTEFFFPDRQNFAYGGALSNDGNIFSPILGSVVDNTGVFDQLDEYFSQFPNNVADTAFIIYIGPNDLFAMTDLLDPDSASSLMEIIDNIETSVDRLQNASATDITVVGLPDLSQIPFIQNDYSYLEQRMISLACTRFNHMLKDMADDRGIEYFPTDMVMKEIIANPKKYNLSNVTDACMIIEEDEITVCDTPNAYLFWDSVHPTSYGHKLFAQAFVQ